MGTYGDISGAFLFGYTAGLWYFFRLLGDTFRHWHWLETYIWIRFLTELIS
jgi:hypothetical protein